MKLEEPVGAERIKGYTAEEIIGKHFSIFYPPDALARNYPAYELEIATRSGRYEDEGWRIRKDGTRFWANVIITAVRSPSGELRGFAKLTRDLTQRKRIEALEEGERRTNEFLAMLAHELRNPLAPIHNAVSMMRMSEISDPEIRWSREVIERQTTHMSRLVDDLLDVSRLTTGKIALRAQFLDARDIVREAVEAARMSIQARKHQLETEISQEPLSILGDPTRLTQIVANLLNNASKYTPEEGQIRIVAAREGKDIVIRVEDNGIGIRRELIPRMFDLFVQGERSLARSEGGLGIGLTMVRQLVQLHGGSVEARSEGAGKGSQFIVRIPAATSPARSTTAAQPSPPKLVHEDHRVLVVDDNRDSAETMCRILEHWGYPTRVVYDGRSACTLARDWRPKTVLLDIGLPGMSGYEVLDCLRTEAGLTDAVVVAMTGYGKESHISTAAAGFADHFVKPVDLNRLKDLLERV